jgi:hypothetical protein
MVVDFFGKKVSKRSSLHNVNGGIQIYPRIWIEEIGGLDESLVYWGGIDNDTVERALMSDMIMVNLNTLILHQEHEFKKEQHLPEKEQRVANLIRMEKSNYLGEMAKKGEFIRNGGWWGSDEPNQERFLSLKRQLEEEERKKEEEEQEYNKAFIEAVKKGRKSFKFNGRRVMIYGSR